MNAIAKFEKVSFEVYKQACESLLPQLSTDEIITAYENIRLPRRATAGSAGYDFFSPIKLDGGLKKGGDFTFPTGIRCKMDEGWVLVLAPRSSMGFKSGVHLANTVGIIDQDYYYSDNEGHIMVKLVNDSSLAKTLKISCGDAFCQGVLLPFGTAEGDDAAAKRNGGFGSTGN